MNISFSGWPDKSDCRPNKCLFGGPLEKSTFSLRFSDFLIQSSFQRMEKIFWKLLSSIIFHFGNRFDAYKSVNSKLDQANIPIYIPNYFLFFNAYNIHNLSMGSSIIIENISWGWDMSNIFWDLLHLMILRNFSLSFFFKDICLSQTHQNHHQTCPNENGYGICCHP